MWLPKTPLEKLTAKINGQKAKAMIDGSRNESSGAGHMGMLDPAGIREGDSDAGEGLIQDGGLKVDVPGWDLLEGLAPDLV